MTDEVLINAINLIKAGRKVEAQKILEPYIVSNPHNVHAWIWEAETQDTIAKKIRVLETCLRYNPDEQQIKRALSLLKTNEGSSKIGEQKSIPDLPQGITKENLPSNEASASSSLNQINSVNTRTSSKLSKNIFLKVGIVLAIIVFLCVAAIVALQLFGKQSTAALTASLRAKALIMPNHANCTRFSFSNLSYDVRRTDSLVSPYMGIISGSFDDKGLKFDSTITLAYQNNKWIPTNADTSSLDLYMSNNLDRDLLIAAGNLLLTCLE